MVRVGLMVVPFWGGGWCHSEPEEVIGQRSQHGWVPVPVSLLGRSGGQGGAGGVRPAGVVMVK